MVYSQARLEEAIRIIEADNNRLRKARDERYAQTHYRDDFQLRRCKQPLAPVLPLYADFEPEVDDDEDYDPDKQDCSEKIRRTRRSGDGSKEKTVPRQPVKPPKGEHEPILPGGLASVYVTLRLQRPESKDVMQQLSIQYGTQRDVWLRHLPPNEQCLWASSGGSFTRLGSPEEMRQLAMDLVQGKLEISSAKGSTLERIQEKQVATSRSLRNGKVRATIQKRRKEREKGKLKRRTRTRIWNLDQDKSSSRKSSTPIAIASSSQELSRDLPEPGSSLAHSICIDSDDEESDEEDDLMSGPSSSGSATLSPSRQTSVIDLTDLPDEEVSDEGAVTTIETSFAHPIDFRYTRRPCNFCSDYRFGILGHRIKQVTVATNSSGIVAELDNGHAERYGPSKMCTSCALDRMMVTRCITHHFQHLQTALTKSERSAYAMDLVRMDAQRSTDPPPPIQRICSICAMPATYTCTSLQKTDRMLNPTINPAVSTHDQTIGFQQLMQHRRNHGQSSDFQLKPPLYGCGLALCEDCKVVVVERCAGRLVRSAVVAAASIRCGGAKGMVRGDVDFLFRDGPLWKSYNPH